MSCSNILDMVYYNEENISLLNHLQIGFHAFFCQDCARKIELYNIARASMKEDFFPSVDIEDSVMARIAHENENEEAALPVHGVPSTRGWVIAGVVLVVSLVSAFFGFDFRRLASESGMSFMLPMGITIGLILTVYCALFIGSHLKELSERFGL
ncbi:MAG: peptidoglycan-binding protein [Treponema sp.]|nr:peptidoglycan-binding protein [Treponema sp.]MCL2237198.1 peptidoglycan-binding protein [Treponema sp.]